MDGYLLGKAISGCSRSWAQHLPSKPVFILWPHPASSQQNRDSHTSVPPVSLFMGCRIQPAALQVHPERSRTLGVRTGREGFAPRAAAQDAMKAAWKQVPLPNSLQRVPGWSHLLLLCPAATSRKLHVLASHCLSPGGCNVGCHITCPDCLLPLPGCCSGTVLERWIPQAGCTTGLSSYPAARERPLHPLKGPALKFLMEIGARAEGSNSVLIQVLQNWRHSLTHHRACPCEAGADTTWLGGAEPSAALSLLGTYGPNPPIYCPEPFLTCHPAYSCQPNSPALLRLFGAASSLFLGAFPLSHTFRHCLSPEHGSSPHLYSPQVLCHLQTPRCQPCD